MDCYCDQCCGYGPEPTDPETLCASDGHRAHYPGGSCWCMLNLCEATIGAKLVGDPDYRVPTEPYVVCGPRNFEYMSRTYGL